MVNSWKKQTRIVNFWAKSSEAWDWLAKVAEKLYKCSEVVSYHWNTWDLKCTQILIPNWRSPEMNWVEDYNWLVEQRWPSAFVPASPSFLAPSARLPRWSPASSDPSPLGKAIMVTVINTSLRIPNENPERLSSAKHTGSQISIIIRACPSIFSHKTCIMSMICLYVQ